MPFRSLFSSRGGTYFVARNVLPVSVCNSSQYLGQTQKYSSLPTTKIPDASDTKAPKSIYDFTVQDTYGKDVSLDKYKGKVLIIVNTASQCKLASSNYKSLTKLNKDYENAGFKMLAFPCNQFASESPEKDGEEMVCHLKKENADIGDVFKKIDVNGEHAAPLYKFLRKEQGSYLGDSVKWNFTKFLVDKEGQPVDRYAPTTPMSSVEKKIDLLLKK